MEHRPDWAWDARDAAPGDTVTFLATCNYGGGDEEREGTLVGTSKNFRYVVTGTTPEDRVLWEVNADNGWEVGTFAPLDACGVQIGDEWPDGTIDEVLEDGRLRIHVPGRGDYLIALPSFEGTPIGEGKA